MQAMRDDTRESSSGAASQKSVTDWLMHVISGKNPVELNLNEGPEQSCAEPKAEIQAPVPETAKTAAAVEDRPDEEKKSQVEARTERFGVQAEAATAKDPRGTPVSSESRWRAEEVAAVDPGSVEKARQISPQPEAGLDIFRTPDGQAPESHRAKPQAAELRMPTPDLWREVPQKNGFSVIRREPEPKAEEPVVTIADISRDPVPLVGESEIALENLFLKPAIETELRVAAAPAAEVVSEPKAAEAEDRTEAVAAQAETQSAIGDESGIQAEEVAAAPAIEVVKAAVPVAENESATEPRAAAIELHGSAPVDGRVDGPELMVEALTIEPITPKADGAGNDEVSGEAAVDALAEPGSDVGAEGVPESIFAREGIWTKAAKGDVYQAPAYRERRAVYPSPEELSEIEKVRPEGWVSAWKTLLRLSSVLPWIARAMPMIEPQGAGEPKTGNEMRAAIEEHSLQLKRIEEELSLIRQGHEELAGGMRSAAKLVRWMGIGLGGLLLILIVMAALVLARGR
jgi:hypothetical protein